METRWIIQFCFWFFFFWKKCQSGGQSLHITSAWHLYPGCHGNLVAMRSIYLEIWQLQMSLGAALSNNALVKLQTVKAHTYSLFWPLLTGKILINTENVCQVSHGQFGCLPVVNHSQLFVMVPSLLSSFCQTYRTKCTLWSVQNIRRIP